MISQGTIQDTLNQCAPNLQVQAAARAYRVYYTKTSDDPKDYLVDHSIIMYLVDPKGDFVTFFGKNVAEPELAAGIWDRVRAWKGTQA